MSSWQERVDLQTDPQVMLEHVVRYRFARPIVRRADVWIDLGCGTGLPAEEALGDCRPRRTLLVDLDRAALDAAQQRFPGEDTTTAAVDLATPDGVAVLDEHVRSLPGDGAACVTCFETVEHLADFGPLLSWLTALVSERAATVVLSVPDDSFWALHNPYHQTMWGGGAFEEFRRLLPDGAVVAHQLALHGSALESLDGDRASARDASVPTRPDAVPTHYVAVFGGDVAALEPVLGVQQLDLVERRAWERQRDADLVWLRQRVLDLEYEEGLLRRQLDELRAARDRPADGSASLLDGSAATTTEGSE